MEYFMFKRPHHQAVAKILKSFDCDLLQKANCYFAGGTAIVLLLSEYRESIDIDFLCGSPEGYRLLRNIVSEQSLGALLKEPVKHLREVRADRYGIRTVLEMDARPVRVELVSEARIAITGHYHSDFGVPVLSREDIYAEKLLANADRGTDRSTMSKDIIDLAMVIKSWGDLPEEALKKVYKAYGQQVLDAYLKSFTMISDKNYLSNCLKKMHMDEQSSEFIISALESQLSRVKCFQS
jgi:predicted nucleotidyltransferase component of viral defense system